MCRGRLLRQGKYCSGTMGGAKPRRSSLSVRPALKPGAAGRSSGWAAVCVPLVPLTPPPVRCRAPASNLAVSLARRAGGASCCVYSTVLVHTDESGAGMGLALTNLASAVVEGGSPPAAYPLRLGRALS